MELFPKLCDQYLLLAEQHTGKGFYDSAEAEQFIHDNVGTFMSMMVAASESKINLIAILHETRDKWLSNSQP